MAAAAVVVKPLVVTGLEMGTSCLAREIEAGLVAELELG